MFANRRAILIGLTVLMTGCASAGKRLEQGQHLEMQGRYEAAVTRYVQALEKDPSLEEARLRLLEVGNIAVEERLQNVAMQQTRGDVVAAATQFQGIDRVVAQARSVGVRLDLPTDYEQERRAAFDTAIDSLMDEAQMAQDQRRWEDGLECYRRARRDFEPSSQQRTATLSGESELLVDWSNVELAAGRLRSAYDIAAAVQELEWSPADDHDSASRVMELALDSGQVELLVLPLMTSPRMGRSQREMAARVNDRLSSGPWRQPPAFIRVTDPGAVLDLMRNLGGLDGDFRAPALAALLKLTDAEFGAWLQLVDIDATEYDVKETNQAARKRDGQPATIVLEEGQKRLQAQARVIVVDRLGNALVDVIVTGTGSGRFRRGRYEGDPADLNLSRHQLDWFDRVAQADQDESVRESLVTDLAANLAPAVLNSVLATIP